jgi:hypothetical protein
MTPHPTSNGRQRRSLFFEFGLRFPPWMKDFEGFGWLSEPSREGQQHIEQDKSRKDELERHLIQTP